MLAGKPVMAMPNSPPAVAPGQPHSYGPLPPGDTSAYGGGGPTWVRQGDSAAAGAGIAGAAGAAAYPGGGRARRQLSCARVCRAARRLSQAGCSLHVFGFHVKFDLYHFPQMLLAAWVVALLWSAVAGPPDALRPAANATAG